MEDIMIKNEKVENKQPLTSMVSDSLKYYKDELLIKKVNDTYNDILQGLPQDKIDIIESTTKKIVKKEEIAECLDLMYNYLGLERLIRRFGDLQSYIHNMLRKDGISDQMLVDTLYTLTGEDIHISLSLKNELNNAFYKLHLLTNEDIRNRQHEEMLNNIYRISPN